MTTEGFVSPANLRGIVYTYDKFDRKDLVSYPNGTTVDYTYNGATGWLSQVAHQKDGAANPFLSLTYARNGIGLIKGVSESANGAATGSWTYDYDGLKRLTAATWTPDTGSPTAYGYTYDRNGNRRSYDVTGSARRHYVYNELDQLREERLGTSLGASTLDKSYTWDKYGRMASEGGAGVPPAIDRLYKWTVDDRLVSVVLGDNPSNDPVIKYAYDHLGTRVGRSALGETAKHLTDYENPSGYSQTLAEVEGDGLNVLTHYFYGSEYGPLAQRGAGANSLAFLHGDHLQTTRQLTDSDGDVLLASSQKYEPFGTPTPDGLSSLTSYAFTGQSRDLDTGLQYHRARWLNTSQGRWLSTDPIWDFHGNSANPYTYCNIGSPIACADPSGLENYTGLTMANYIVGFLAAGAIIGAYVGGPRGAVYGGLIGLGVGVAFVALLRNPGRSLSGLLFGNVLWILILYATHLATKPNPRVPQAPMALPAGFITINGGDVGRALLVFPADRIHPAMGPNEFGEAKLTAVAQIFYENGYTVTYGRPSSKEELDDQLFTREYDFIYILGHGGQAGSGGKGIKVIEGGDWTDVDDDTYLMIQELKGLVGTPEFVFLDGCSLDNVDGVKGRAIGHTLQDYGGTPATTLQAFLMLLFSARHNGNVKASFEEVYNNPAVVENPNIFKLERDATLPTDSRETSP